MQVLYLDCSMGAAGDMLGGALAELLGDEEREAFVAEINAAGIPGVSISLDPSVKCGLAGTHMTVTVNGKEEGAYTHERAETEGIHAHEHAENKDAHARTETEGTHAHTETEGIHAHEHAETEAGIDSGREQGDLKHEHVHDDHAHSNNGQTHTHTHRSLHDIKHIIKSLKLPGIVRSDISAVYELIAEAESKAHGKPVSEIHFHEVGTADAIADIASVCLLLHILAPQQIIASPINVGSGQVKCAHGILPVPAPATAYILNDVPIYSGNVRSELCTPTGAALLKHFVTRFGLMPAMTPAATGCGMGTKDFEEANCVRIILGQSFADEATNPTAPKDVDKCNTDAPKGAATSNTENPGEVFADSVCELACNVDDMTGEDIAFAIETFMRNGALDAFTTPCTMKKGRPGILITVLCREADQESVAQMMLRHTTTLGVRITTKERRILARTESECSIPKEALKHASAETATGSPAESVSDSPMGSSELAAEPADADCTVRCKTSTGCGVSRTKYEHDDLANIARTYGLTLDQVRALLRELQ